MGHLITVFIAAILTHNIALTYLLGMCPFVSLSRSLKTATGMSLAVLFVVTLTAGINWPVYHLLVKTDSTIIYYIVFIVVIAASVQLVEMIVEKFSPALYTALGIFLPLITVNCAILGVALFLVERKYTLAQSTVFGISSGVGFFLAIVTMAAIRKRIRYSNVIPALRGLGITMILTGLLAMAFMIFSGIQL